MDSSAPILEVRGLSAGYGDLLAARGVSYHVCPGEIVAMFGGNGAGKTTTLLATVGELPRQAGQVLWKGKRATSALHKLARAGLSFVPEAPSVIAGLSARDNLRLGRGPAELALSYFTRTAPSLRDLLTPTARHPVPPSHFHVRKPSGVMRSAHRQSRQPHASRRAGPRKACASGSTPGAVGSMTRGAPQHHIQAARDPLSPPCPL